MRYELVHEILNECPNNQMRDIFIQEVETESRVDYVKAAVKGKDVSILCEECSDGGMIFHVNCAGLLQKFTFSPDA